MSSTFLSNPQVTVVSDFKSLISTAYSKESNAICWERKLHANFEEIVCKLELQDDITEISTEQLLALDLSENGNAAREIILNDIQQLIAIGAAPSLNLLRAYERDDALDFIATDVYSFHVDRSPIPTHTYLCTYFGAASDIIPNADVRQKIENTVIEKKLRALHEPNEGTFEAFLEQYFFDLHYEVLNDTRITNLGIGNLWKLAVDHPQQNVQPCVHRAPVENKDELRLLLIC